MKPKKIKILHIQETIGSGGVERLRLSLAKLLDKNKFEQKIICTVAVGNIADEIKKEGIEIIPIGLLTSVFQRKQHKKVQKIIEDFQPDIIHGAVFEGVTLAVINGFLKRVPIIIMEETSDPQNRSWKGNLLIKLFTCVSHAVIGVSESVAEEYLKQKLKISEKKVKLINNGVALPAEVLNDDVEKTKAIFQINENDFVIGSVGRMLQDGNKRFSDLIKAFAKFAESKKDVKLLLLGDGPEKIEYEKLVLKQNIKDKVVFVGYQSNVTLFYKIMNVFSLVSANEAFGLVLAEAMLNKLPVIATRVGGMKYIVEDNNTGFLVEKYNIKEIAEKMEILYQNKSLRKQMGGNGYKKALLEYTEKAYVEKIESLYMELYNAYKI